ncbi:hypothetical protein OIU76_015570 [Salix suchowensis]|nr:hypothetical protein OIU76_015570 [Salix suchowensis]
MSAGEKFGANACVQGCGTIGTCTLKMFCFGGGGGGELMVAARGNFLKSWKLTLHHLRVFNAIQRSKP